MEDRHIHYMYLEASFSLEIVICVQSKFGITLVLISHHRSIYTFINSNRFLFFHQHLFIYLSFFFVIEEAIKL